MARQDWAEKRGENLAAKSKARGSGRRNRTNNGDDFNLTLEDWFMLQALAAALHKEGGALRIGMTRDAGALALGVYVGQDYGTEYIRPSEELNTALVEIADEWLVGKAALYSEELDKVADAVIAYITARTKNTK